MKERLQIGLFSFFVTFLVSSVAYNLLNGGDKTMNEIVGAIIGLIAAIVSVGIVEIVGWKKVHKLIDNGEKIPIAERFNNLEKRLDNDIGVDKNAVCLTEQHRNLEKFLEKEMNNSLKEATKSANRTYDIIKLEKEQRSQRELLLSANEYRLAQALDEISGFKDVFLAKSKDVQQLTQRISVLEAEKHELQRKIAEQESRIYELEELQNSDDDEEMGDREI